MMKWKEKLAEMLPLLGHRNWILVVDKAYPLQSASGITTLYAAEPITKVLEHTLSAVRGADHIRPVIYMDRELSFIDEELCKGVNDLKQQYAAATEGLQVNSLLHDDIFPKLDAASKLFSVLAIKTDCLIPYSSIFIELDCGYWDAERENFLRDIISRALLKT